MFKGSFTALITPFKDGKVDEASFERLVEWQIAEGTHGLVPVGTTGESPTLSHDEHKHVVELCIKTARKRVPVIAGAGSNSTAEAIDFTRHAKKAGADAVLHSTGYYNKPTQDGLYQPLQGDQRRRRSPDLPLQRAGAHHRRHLRGDHGALRAAQERGRRQGCDRQRRASPQQRLACGKDFIQLSGEDATALGFMAHGGHGCISVTSNVAPRLCSEFQNACLKGDLKTALELQDKLMPLHDALFVETNPARSSMRPGGSASLPRRSAACRWRRSRTPPRRWWTRRSPASAHCRPRRPNRRDSQRSDSERGHGGQQGRRPQAHRGEPQGALRVRHRRHLRGRHPADRHRGEVAAHWPGQHRRELCLGRERRHLPDQRLHPRVQGGRRLLPARAAPAAPPAAAQARNRTSSPSPSSGRA